MLINQCNVKPAIKILALKTKALDLRIRYTELGLYEHEKAMHDLNQNLAVLFKSFIKYDFLNRIALTQKLSSICSHQY